MKLVHMKNGSWHAYVFGPVGFWHLIAWGRTRKETLEKAKKTPEYRYDKEAKCGR